MKWVSDLWAFPDLSSPEKGSVFGPSQKEQQGQCDWNSMSRQERMVRDQVAWGRPHRDLWSMIKTLALSL